MPLDSSADGVGKVRFSSRLLRAIQGVFVFRLTGRPLAAAYLGSVDPIASFAQRLTGTLGWRKAEYFAWEIRVGWRQWFEDKVCAIANDRTLASLDVVLSFYDDMSYLLPPRAREVLYSRLTHALRDDTAFTVEMAELQKLPVGPTALRRRILALDAAVETHVAVLAHDMVVGRMALNDVARGGVR
jgi:hypothetical protein